MDGRNRSLAGVTLIFVFFIVVIIVAGAIMNAKRVISPVPEDNAIKIIFISPTPTGIVPTNSSPVEVHSSPSKIP
jgi:hypothetical protein